MPLVTTSGQEVLVGPVGFEERSVGLNLVAGNYLVVQNGAAARLVNVPQNLISSPLSGLRVLQVYNPVVVPPVIVQPAQSIVNSDMIIECGDDNEGDGVNFILDLE